MKNLIWPSIDVMNMRILKIFFILERYMKPLFVKFSISLVYYSKEKESWNEITAAF